MLSLTFNARVGGAGLLMLATVMGSSLVACGDDSSHEVGDAGPDGSDEGSDSRASGGRGARGGSGGSAGRGVRDGGSRSTDQGEEQAGAGGDSSDKPDEPAKPTDKPTDRPTNPPPGTDDDAGVETVAGSLRSAAAMTKRQIGAVVNPGRIGMDTGYKAVLEAEFNSVTADTMSWSTLQSVRGQWWFEESDFLVGSAMAAGQAVRGHSLMSPGAEPAWVAALTSAELQVELERHVTTVVTHFKGKVSSWNVLHEVLDQDTLQLRTGLIATLGVPGLAQVFKSVKAADPDALLYYNELGIERPGPMADAALKLVQDLKAAGAPIDGVGIETHLSTSNYPPEAVLRANLKRFAEVVPNVEFTELAVATQHIDPMGNAARRRAAQRVPYQLVTGVCATEPACRGVSTWGISDKYTWYAPEEEPLLFDMNWQPKPAYEGAIAGFMGKVPAITGPELLGNADFEMVAQLDWVSFGGGVLTMQTAVARTGQAAAITNRMQTYEGLGQSLLTSKPNENAVCLSAWVRVDAPSAPVNANVKLGGGEAAQYNLLATAVANNTAWVELQGCGTLRVDASLTEAALYIDGPPAGVTLYVDDMSVKALR